jgi:hypothetical protein
MRVDEASLEKGIALLDTYISGSDRSEAFVGRVGVFFDENVSDSELLDDLVIAASSYEQTGGELLFDEASFLDLCVRAKSVLEKYRGTRSP